MDGRSLQELRDELSRLMLQHVESVRTETFVGPDPEMFRRHEETLKRIREVSAAYLAAMKREAG